MGGAQWISSIYSREDTLALSQSPNRLSSPGPGKVVAWPPLTTLSKIELAKVSGYQLPNARASLGLGIPLLRPDLVLRPPAHEPKTGHQRRLLKLDGVLGPMLAVCQTPIAVQPPASVEKEASARELRAHRGLLELLGHALGQ